MRQRWGAGQSGHEQPALSGHRLGIESLLAMVRMPAPYEAGNTASMSAASAKIGHERTVVEGRRSLPVEDGWGALGVTGVRDAGRAERQRSDLDDLGRSQPPIRFDPAHAQHRQSRGQ